MREILFKAKRIDNGEWVEGDLVHSVYKKANELYRDIENINKVLEEKAEHRWISVISARRTELYYSMNFQTELAEWLKQKKEQYQKELDAL